MRRNRVCLGTIKSEAELQAAAALTEIFSISAEFGIGASPSPSSI
jgi:hypothetical protein